MTTLLTAIETLVDIFEFIRSVYRAGVWCIACIWVVCMFFYQLGVAASNRCEGGGRAWALREFAPCLQVLRTVALMILDGIEWAVNDGINIVNGTVINAVALIEWAAVEMVTADLLSYELSVVEVTA